MKNLLSSLWAWFLRRTIVVYYQEIKRQALSELDERRRVFESISLARQVRFYFLTSPQSKDLGMAERIWDRMQKLRETVGYHRDRFLKHKAHLDLVDKCFKLSLRKLV